MKLKSLLMKTVRQVKKIKGYAKVGNYEITLTYKKESKNGKD